MPTPKARFDITAQDKTKGAFASVNKSLGGLKTAFAGLGAGLSVAGLTKIVNATLDANDNIAKLSQSTGLAVETLNSYDLAAQLAGTNIEGVSKGIAKFQRTLYDAVGGLLEAKESFEAMGISVLDGNKQLRNTEDILLEVADKFATYEDGAGKAALAQKLFGRSGVQLIPLLNQGGAAIRAYTEENNALGNVLTDEVAAASERVNDNFVRLQTSTKGVRRDLTEGLLPALEDITELLVDFAKESGDAAKILGETLGGTLKGLATGILVVKNAFDIIIDSFRSTGAAIASLAAGDWRSALDLLSQGGRDMLGEYEDIVDGVGDLWFKVSTDILNDADETSDKIAAPLVYADDKIKTAAKSITKTVKDETDEVFALIDAQFKALDRQEALKEAGLAPPDPGELERARIYEETRTPAEKLSAEIEHLNEVFDYGAKDFDTYSRAMFAAQEQFDSLTEKADETGDKFSVFAEQAARNMQDAFADYLFNPFEDGLEGMLTSFVTTLRRMAAEYAAQAIFQSVGTGLVAAGAGGAAGGPFGAIAASVGSFLLQGSGKASGGPVRAGVAYPVGEDGPETFVPAVNGNIIPNNQPGGGTMNFFFSVQGTVDRRTGMQAGYDAARAYRLATERNG